MVYIPETGNGERSPRKVRGGSWAHMVEKRQAPSSMPAPAPAPSSNPPPAPVPDPTTAPPTAPTVTAPTVTTPITTPVTTPTNTTSTVTTPTTTPTTPTPTPPTPTPTAVPYTPPVPITSVSYTPVTYTPPVQVTPSTTPTVSPPDAPPSLTRPTVQAPTLPPTGTSTEVPPTPSQQPPTGQTTTAPPPPPAIVTLTSTSRAQTTPKPSAQTTASSIITFTTTDARGSTMVTVPGFYTTTYLSTSANGAAMTVIQIVEQPLTYQQSDGGGSGFFKNKPAVAGVFVVAGIVGAAVILFGLFTYMKKKRARRLNSDTMPHVVAPDNIRHNFADKDNYDIDGSPNATGQPPTTMQQVIYEGPGGTPLPNQFASGNPFYGEPIPQNMPGPNTTAHPPDYRMSQLLSGTYNNPGGAGVTANYPGPIPGQQPMMGEGTYPMFTTTGPQGSPASTARPFSMTDVSTSEYGTSLPQGPPQPNVGGYDQRMSAFQQMGSTTTGPSTIGPSSEGTTTYSYEKTPSFITTNPADTSRQAGPMDSGAPAGTGAVPGPDRRDWKDRSLFQQAAGSNAGSYYSPPPDRPTEKSPSPFSNS